ncbi:hypothetical protein NX059_005747 [Plenodomus lindquistii]|nr:hypothetical protein NX059_005747 [Plenodomus lindquistii]
MSLGTRRHAPKVAWSLALMFGFAILIPGSHASVHHDRRLDIQRRTQLHVRDTGNRVRSVAENFSAELATKANALGQNGETLAHNLVAGVISSVCDAYFEGDTTGSFSPAIVKNCIKSVYGGEKLPQAAAQFYAVFGTSLLCDFVVSEAYPIAQDLVPEGCEGLQQLAEKISPATTAASPPNINTQTTPLSLDDQSANARPPTGISLSLLPAASDRLTYGSLSVGPSSQTAIMDSLTPSILASGGQTQTGLLSNALIFPSQSQVETQAFISATSLASLNDATGKSGDLTVLTTPSSIASSKPATIKAASDKLVDPNISTASDPPVFPSSFQTAASSQPIPGRSSSIRGSLVTTEPAGFPKTIDPTSQILAALAAALPSPALIISNYGIMSYTDTPQAGTSGSPSLTLASFRSSSLDLVNNQETRRLSANTPNSASIPLADPFLSPTQTSSDESQAEIVSRTTFPPGSKTSDTAVSSSMSIDPLRISTSPIVSSQTPSKPLSSLFGFRPSGEIVSSNTDSAVLESLSSSTEATSPAVGTRIISPVVAPTTPRPSLGEISTYR